MVISLCTFKWFCWRRYLKHLEHLFYFNDHVRCISLLGQRFFFCKQIQTVWPWLFYMQLSLYKKNAVLWKYRVIFNYHCMLKGLLGVGCFLCFNLYKKESIAFLGKYYIFIKWMYKHITCKLCRLLTVVMIHIQRRSEL